MEYKTIKIREDVYRDIIRLQGFLQLKYQTRLSIQDVIIYLLSQYEEKQDGLILETAGLSVTQPTRGRKKKRPSPPI